MTDTSEFDRYFRLEPVDGVTIIHFVDNQVATDSKELLYSLVEKLDHRKLLLDLSDIPMLSTFGLGILANLQRKVDQAGGQLKFCCLSDDLLKLFRMTKFDQIFELYPNQAEALKAFSKPQ